MIVAVDRPDNLVTKFRVKLNLPHDGFCNGTTADHQHAIPRKSGDPSVDRNLAVNFAPDNDAQDAEKPDIDDHLAGIVAQDWRAFEEYGTQAAGHDSTKRRRRCHDVDQVDPAHGALLVVQ